MTKAPCMNGSNRFAVANKNSELSFMLILAV
jgi:hypothetical protein